MSRSSHFRLPTRRPFDSPDQIDERIRRADGAFAMAYELGTKIVLARAGAVPPEDEPARREPFTTALRELAARAEHRGVRLAIETGQEPAEPLHALLETIGSPALAASIEPSRRPRGRHRPDRIGPLARRLDHPRLCERRGSLSRVCRGQPARVRFSSRALDWEEYLGALEEIGYRGFLTVWPAPDRPVDAQWNAITRRLDRIG